MEYIDKIIYINLDHRADRREEFTRECTRLSIPPEKVIRFSACTHEDPVVGCAMSHAYALQMAHTMGLSNVLICEDDFTFHDDPTMVQCNLTHFFTTIHYANKPWKAVQLAHNIYESKSYDTVLSLAVRVSNAAGYLVNGSSIQPLSQAIQTAIEPLRTTKSHWHYANDVVWCTFMKDDQWYLFTEKLGYQRPSYSDLSRTFIHQKR